MSASREKRARQDYVPAPAPEKKKTSLQTVLAIVAVVVSIALIATIVLVRGPFFNKHSTAIKAGNEKLSPVAVRYYYFDAYTTMLNNGYNYMLSMMYPDGVTNLDQQEYGDGVTFGEYFMDYAKEQIKAVYATYEAAIADGYDLTKEEKDEIDSLKSTLDLYAVYSGAASADSYLSAIYGPGATWESYKNYITVSSIASGYAAQYKDEKILIPAEEIAATYNADPAKYNSYNYHVYSVISDYESGADEDTIHAAYEEAKQRAEAIVAGSTDLTAYLTLCGEDAGDPEAYEDGSRTFRSNYRTASMSDSYRDWVTDAARVKGDTTVVTVDESHLCYVLYYVGMSTNDYSTVNARIVEIDADLSEDGSYDMTGASQKADLMQSDYKDGINANTEIGELFTSLVNDYGGENNTEGGLYENIYNGYLDETVNNWLFEEGRKQGDTTLVVNKDTGKIYFVYFVSTNEQSYRDYLVENELREAAYNTWNTSLTENFTLEENEFGMKRVDCTLVFTPSSDEAVY